MSQLEEYDEALAELRMVYRMYKIAYGEAPEVKVAVENPADEHLAKRLEILLNGLARI